MKKTIILILLIAVCFINTTTVFAGRTEYQETAELTNPLGNDVTPQTLIGRVIKAALGLTGSIALVMFIYGGFMWMTSAGSQEKVTKGKGVIVWATLGLVVIFSAYALVRFVFTGLGVT